MIAVIDTSALVRLFIPDGPAIPDLEQAMAEAERGETLLLAPELIWAETAQVLLKKQRAGLLTDVEADELWHDLAALPIRAISHLELIPDALCLARRLNLTVYDALFLALARSRHARLFTGDQKLTNAAAMPGAAE